MKDIIVWESQKNNNQVQLKFEQDTVWATQGQISEIFGVDRSVITKHIRNIFNECELDEKSNVQKMHIANSDKLVTFYGLDMILSVGYRVNSARATQFRIWATNRLKDYLLKGYAINESRLQKVSENLLQLQSVVASLQVLGDSDELKLGEAKGIIDIINRYTKTFVLLNQYDGDNFKRIEVSDDITYEIEYEEAMSAIRQLKKEMINRNEATSLFGNEKDDSFKGILGSVVQSFGGEYLYPSIEEQAAHLLYFVIKNHPFSDGNKRIASFLFIFFLNRNKYGLKTNGSEKINDNALTALALLIAQSNPDDKEVMITLIVHLISNS